MRLVPLALFVLLPLSCTDVFDGGNGEGGGEGEGGSSDGVVSIVVSGPDGDVDCDPECTVDFGDVHVFTENVTADLTLTTTALVTFDAVVVDGCERGFMLSNLFSRGGDVAARTEASIGMDFDDDGDDELGDCTTTFALFSNAANQPDDGFLIRVHANIFRRDAVGDPCVLSGFSNGVTCAGQVASFCEERTNTIAEEDCGAAGLVCNGDGDAFTQVCLIPIGGACSVDTNDDSVAPSDCVGDFDVPGVCMVNSDGVGVCQTLDEQCLVATVGEHTEVGFDCPDCEFGCLLPSGAACLPVETRCGADFDDAVPCPASGVCP